jgi:hypothetical protein
VRSAASFPLIEKNGKYWEKLMSSAFFYGSKKRAAEGYGLAGLAQDYAIFWGMVDKPSY